MSQATKRKHVAKEVLDDYVVPDPNQQIVKVGEQMGRVSLPSLLSKHVVTPIAP